MYSLFSKKINIFRYIMNKCSMNQLFVLSYHDLFAEKLYFHCLEEDKRSDYENILSTKR